MNNSNRDISNLMLRPAPIFGVMVMLIMADMLCLCSPVTPGPSRSNSADAPLWPRVDGADGARADYGGRKGSDRNGDDTDGRRRWEENPDHSREDRRTVEFNASCHVLPQVLRPNEQTIRQPRALDISSFYSHRRAAYACICAVAEYVEVYRINSTCFH